MDQLLRDTPPHDTPPHDTPPHDTPPHGLPRSTTDGAAATVAEEPTAM